MQPSATLSQASKILSLFEETPPEQVQRILGSGLLADLRDANVALVDRDEFRCVCGLELLAQGKRPALQYNATCDVWNPPTYSTFVVRERFAVNTGNDAKVRISRVSEDFKEFFGSKTEEPFGNLNLRRYILRRLLNTKFVIFELICENKVETELNAIFYLMGRQGESDIEFLSDKTGIDNIFFVRDIHGFLRIVLLRWINGGWEVETRQLGSLCQGFVFSSAGKST